MKRVVFLALVLGLVASACATGRSVGSDLDAPTGIKPSESPKKKPPPKKRDAPKVEQTEDAKEPEAKGNTIIIAVRSNFEGFEYKQPDSGWKPATDGGPAAFVGDTIIFKNMAPAGEQPPTHGWQNEAFGPYKAGELFDSGPLKPGESYTWVVDVEPGQYAYRDSSVPYRSAQGPMQVIER